MSDTESQLITSRSGFHEAVRHGFAEAAAAGCPEIWLCDADFADWPLGERAVVEHLTRWAGAQRRLTLVASHFDEVARRHARWVEWRRNWAHVVQCCTSAEIERGRFPCAMLGSGCFSLTLFSPEHHRGRVSRDAADLRRCRESIDAVLQHSVACFPAATTGL